MCIDEKYGIELGYWFLVIWSLENVGDIYICKAFKILDM